VRPIVLRQTGLCGLWPPVAAHTKVVKKNSDQDVSEHGPRLGSVSRGIIRVGAQRRGQVWARALSVRLLELLKDLEEVRARAIALRRFLGLHAGPPEGQFPQVQLQPRSRAPAEAFHQALLVFRIGEQAVGDLAGRSGEPVRGARPSAAYLLVPSFKRHPGLLGLSATGCPLTTSPSHPGRSLS